MTAAVLRYEAQLHHSDYWSTYPENILGKPLVKPLETPYPADPGNTGADQGWARAEFVDSDWPSMQLPGSWTSQGHRYSGVFWFRKTVEIPAAWGRSRFDARHRRR